LVLETEKGEDSGGTIEGSGESAPPTRMEDERVWSFLQVGKSHQFLGEPINLLQSISVFFHLSQGRIEELTGILSEMSGTPITMEMTCQWLDLDPEMKEIPYDRDYNTVHEHLSTHCLQSHRTDRHVDHDGELDHQTKRQPYHNALGSELCTPRLPVGLRTTSQQGSRNGG